MLGRVLELQTQALSCKTSPKNSLLQQELEGSDDSGFTFYSQGNRVINFYLTMPLQEPELFGLKQMRFNS